METFVVLAGKPTIIKDPNAVLDYTVDFTDWLTVAQDTIASHTVATVGCTKQSSTNDTTKVVVWIAGGTTGTPASATVHITTAAGRIDDRTIYFKIKER